MSNKSTLNALLTGAFLLAGSLTSSVAFAQTATDPAPLVVGVYPTKQADKICLSVEKQPNTLAFVQLLTPTGKELYSDTLPRKGTGFRQLFDLSELADGLYSLRVRQGETVIVKSIQLRTTAPAPKLLTRSLILGN